MVMISEKAFFIDVILNQHNQKESEIDGTVLLEIVLSSINGSLNETIKA